MAKRAKRKKPKNISPETGVVLEYSEDQVKVIAEHILSVDKKLGRLKAIEEAVRLTQENMEIMKMDMDTVKTDMEITKVDMDTMKIDMNTMKIDMGFIKYGFKKKVDIDEFAVLEKRVSTLENRL